MRHNIRWTSLKIQSRIDLIETLVYRHKYPIAHFRYLELQNPLDPPPVDPEYDDTTWEIVNPDDYWVHPRTNFILRSGFSIPERINRNGSIALYLPIGIAEDFSHPEALVYIDGEPFAACDRHHQEIILPDKFIDDKNHTLALHGWSGIGNSIKGELHTKLQMGTCMLVQIDQPTRDLVALARVAHGIASHLDEVYPAKHHLLNALDEAFKLLDIRNQIGEDFYNSVPEALEILQQDVEKAGPHHDLTIHAIGHAHIDVAWLWTLGQTRQKAGRTFHNVIRLMDQFPEFIFAQSQPQLYEYLRHDYPILFQEIKKHVHKGRWEIIGGMWVEADCNLSGPESLARQFLLGREFYQEHFKDTEDSPVLWLPDVFGYAWNLPQLIKEAGLKYFFTIKIGWSQYNRLPYDSFWWQGLDGTKILTHFSTTKSPNSPHAATYNSDASPGQIIGTWLNFQQKDYGPVGVIPPLLMSYGYGDGGGGPTREMLENIRVMDKFPASPKLLPSKVIDFFTELESVSENLPTWNGELYLEYHRGTYTTQARNKRANRKSEFLLHDAEFLATYASLLDSTFKYPYDQLKKAWRLVCLNQFHDIIPGSSIAPVYRESLEQYKEIRQIAENASNEALASLSRQLTGRVLVVNPTSFVRDEIIEVNQESVHIGKLPPYSISVVKDDVNIIQEEACRNSSHQIKNRFLLVELNENGDITRIYDKINQREVMPENAIANQFLAFEDIPLSWDAWDIDIFYDDKVWLAEAATSIEVVEAIPYRAALKITRRILNSVYTQVISLAFNSPRLDFDTHINWQERQILLKVAFPVDVLAPTATYEIQWGNVERPTHRNTSWDWARFETAAQKWVDLSEGDYGVSLLNDCKYGHDIRDNVIRLTLLRGTNVPDPEADWGEHRFRYSLLPHAGKWGMDTVREAYAINDPIIVSLSGNHGPQDNPGLKDFQQKSKQLPAFMTTDKNNIVIETIKRAEDGNGVIVRLYEFQRQRGPFSLKTFFPIAKAWRTNILEENQEEITPKGVQINYSIKPYQILTFRLIPDLETGQKK
jgi:alpha-mannosidase